MSTEKTETFATLRRYLWWFGAVVVIAAVVIGLRYLRHSGKTTAPQAPAPRPLQQGERAPEFSAATNQGYFDLSRTGKPVFLEVFATWCPHCRRQTAVIDRLYKEYKGRVAFIGVSGSDRAMDGQSPSSEQDVLNFATAAHANYPLAYDGSLEVAHEYLQGAFPTLVIIGRDKKIAYISTGETPYAELNAALTKAR